MFLRRGSVVMAVLEPTVGHEQKGRRPCLVVSDLDVSSHQRYPMVAIVPLTGNPETGLLRPRLEPGPHNGLTRPSHALIDQVRCVDKRRLYRLLGEVGPEELESVDLGLRLFLGL